MIFKNRIADFGKLIIPFCLLLFVCYSCKSKRKPVESENPLMGNWICKSLIDTITAHKHDSNIFATMELPYAYEFVFDEKFKDSVLVSNGFEQYYLTIKQNGDSIILLNAIQDNNLILVKDSATTKLTLLAFEKEKLKTSAFTFSKPAGDDLQDMGNYFEGFPTAFNKATVAGDYQLIENNELLDFKVHFEPDGKIEGLDDAYLYRCCIAGDCFNMMNHLNTMTVLYKTENEKEMAWSFKGDTLLLFPLHNHKTDEPGHWRKTKSVIKLIVLKP